MKMTKTHEIFVSKASEIFNEMFDWLSNAKSIEWYWYDLHDKNPDCFLRDALTPLETGYRKINDVVIEGRNAAKLVPLEEHYHDYDKIILLSHINNEDKDDIYFKLISLKELDDKFDDKIVFQIIITTKNDVLDYVYYRLFKNTLFEITYERTLPVHEYPELD